MLIKPLNGTWRALKVAIINNNQNYNGPLWHVDSPSVNPRLPRPTCMKRSELGSRLQIQEKKEYTLFFEKEDMYFKSEYHPVKTLGQGSFGMVHLAIKKSNGLKVVYKIIKKGYLPFYTLESSPPPECHSTEISTLYGKYAGARCMSPRPQSLLLPPEIKIQEYLSQPGYGSLYVPRVIDYIITTRVYVLIMEYLGEDWMDLDEYMTKHGKVSMDKARLIIKEVVTALLSLKKLGILHGDVLGWNQDNSASGSSEDESDSWGTEMGDTRDIGQLMYHLLISKDPYNDQIIQKEVAKKLENSLGNPESQLSIDAVDLVTTLFDKKSSKMTSLEDILGHPFFIHQ
ncbi:hypothetical protein BASA62_006295 [Batrachochytrium salamandrivorans]|nr:hypothetical protein BASA62_006295 [Batrachochytrium salamandrivorans]